MIYHSDRAKTEVKLSQPLHFQSLHKFLYMLTDHYMDMFHMTRMDACILRQRCIRSYRYLRPLCKYDGRREDGSHYVKHTKSVFYHSILDFPWQTVILLQLHTHENFLKQPIHIFNLTKLQQPRPSMPPSARGAPSSPTWRPPGRRSLPPSRGSSPEPR